MGENEPAHFFPLNPEVGHESFKYENLPPLKKWKLIIMKWYNNFRYGECTNARYEIGHVKCAVNGTKRKKTKCANQIWLMDLPF